MAPSKSNLCTLLIAFAYLREAMTPCGLLLRSATDDVLTKFQYERLNQKQSLFFGAWKLYKVFLFISKDLVLFLFLVSLLNMKRSAVLYKSHVLFASLNFCSKTGKILNFTFHSTHYKRPKFNNQFNFGHSYLMNEFYLL